MVENWEYKGGVTSKSMKFMPSFMKIYPLAQLLGAAHAYARAHAHTHTHTPIHPPTHTHKHRHDTRCPSFTIKQVK
jgi:hypothetical protein